MSRKIFFIEEIHALVYTKWSRIFSYYRNICTGIYTKIAAARYSSDILQMFYGPITREKNRNQRQPLQPQKVLLYDGFIISQRNFQERLRVWRMDVSKENPNNKDLARENRAKFIDLVEQEIQKLKA